MEFVVSWYNILVIQSYTKTFDFGDISIVHTNLFKKNYIYDTQQSNILTNNWFYYFPGNYVSSSKFPLLLHMCYVSQVGNKRKIFLIIRKFICVSWQYITERYFALNSVTDPNVYYLTERTNDRTWLLNLTNDRYIILVHNPRVINELLPFICSA